LDAVEDFDERAVDGAGETAGEEFVGDGGECVDVGADGDVVDGAAGLLGGHVGECADELSWEGERVVGCAGGDVWCEGGGEAEVEEVRGVGVVEEDVVGLEVSVEDATLVGVVDGVADGGDEGEDALRVGGAWCEDVVEGESVDEVHDVEVVSVVDAGVDDGDDGGVLETGDEFDFALESSARGV